MMDATEGSGGASSQGVNAVDRALAILAAISLDAAPSTLAQLAAATGLYKSTILRLLVSLEKAGYATRLQDGRYALGVGAFRLGAAYERANPLRQHVLPALEGLVESGSESASYHVRHGRHDRLCVLRVDSRHSTLDRVRAGDVLPLDLGAAGRVILAFSGEPGKAFDAVRSQYFTVSRGERDASCAGMSAPVFTSDLQLSGAVSLSGPKDRFTRQMIAEWRPKLIRVAAEMTRSLGGRYPLVEA